MLPVLNDTIHVLLRSPTHLPLLIVSILKKNVENNGVENSENHLGFFDASRLSM